MRLLTASRAIVTKGGRFYAWTTEVDDGLWSAMRSQEPIGIFMEQPDGLYLGRGTLDQVTADDVRLTGQRAKRAGRLAAFLVRWAIRRQG